jgi:hypothetical protein
MKNLFRKLLLPLFKLTKAVLVKIEYIFTIDVFLRIKDLCQIRYLSIIPALRRLEMDGALKVQGQLGLHSENVRKKGKKEIKERKEERERRKEGRRGGRESKGRRVGRKEREERK